MILSIWKHLPPRTRMKNINKATFTRNGSYFNWQFKV